jgi:(4S)-4-hydroxy-5-phosphonooxypentane-2,3-dione isomerase
MRSLFLVHYILAMLSVSRGFYNSLPKTIFPAALARSSLSSTNRYLFRKISTTMSSSSSASGGYLSVHVKGMITPGEPSTSSFYRNTLQNAKESVLESGISRFDVLNRIDNNNEFLLVEVYNSATGPADHKLTAHYNSWRENVANLMAEPRSAAKYTTLFPPSHNWKTDASAGTFEENTYMKSAPWDQIPFAVDSGI